MTPRHRHSRAAALLAAAAVAGAPRGAAGYKYSFEHGIAKVAGSVSDAIYVSEGPMWAAGAGPFGTDGWAGIVVDLRIAVTDVSGSPAPSDLVNVYAAHVDAVNYESLGVFRPTVDADG